MDYTVIVHEAEEGGYWVEVPALPECFSQGETIEEALRNIQEAIALYLEVMAEEGLEPPKDDRWLVARVPVVTVKAP